MWIHSRMTEGMGFCLICIYIFLWHMFCNPTAITPCKLSGQVLTLKALVSNGCCRGHAPTHMFRDPCLPETGLWHSAMRTSGNVLDWYGASRHLMSEEDCQGLFPYCPKIPSVGQYLLSWSQVHIFCRQTVFLKRFPSIHFASAGLLPVTAWKAGSVERMATSSLISWTGIYFGSLAVPDLNHISLGSWCLEWTRSTNTSVSLQTNDNSIEAVL